MAQQPRNQQQLNSEGSIESSKVNKDKVNTKLQVKKLKSERSSNEEIVMIEPEACCSHAPVADVPKKTTDNQKLLKKAVKKAYKAQKLLNEAIKRLEASNESDKKKKSQKHKQRKERKERSESSSSSSSTDTSSSSSSSSSSSTSGSDADIMIALTDPAVNPSKRHHGRKHGHHGRRNRRGRDRSRSRSHSRGRSRGHSRGHSRGRSRGHSRGHSKTRDQQMSHLSQFFRGASLQTAPPIQYGRRQCHHGLSNIRPGGSLGCKPRSRSASRERGTSKKQHKNKEQKLPKTGNKKKRNHRKRDRSHSRGRSHSRDRSHSRGRSHSRDHSRPHSRDRHSFEQNERFLPFLHRGEITGWPMPMPPPAFMQYGKNSEGPRGHHRLSRHENIDPSMLYGMPPMYYREERGRRRRAHSVPRS